ncbi:MAG: cupredoxin domain-containing protein [Microthrixaceae bacterium]
MAAVLAVAVLALAACGDDSDDTTARTGTRTIEIEMRDIAFSPESVRVEAGETVRFVFHNVGAVTHDAFIGDESAQGDHEMEMRGAGDEGMDMDHGGSGNSNENGITVDPGETAELTHTFREGDELLIGCHQEGHYEAGMKVMLNVS